MYCNFTKIQSNIEKQIRFHLKDPSHNVQMVKSVGVKLSRQIEKLNREIEHPAFQLTRTCI